MALSAGADDIKKLVENPKLFLKENSLGVKFNPFNRADFASKAFVKLVPGTEKSYDLKFFKTESENTVSAYVLGYKLNQANDALYLDIPSTGVEEGTFFFTAELSGCSVVVTRLKDDMYRVFHDSRSNSAVLYDNVVMCVDWDDYKIPGQFVEYGLMKGYVWGHAVACMQFRGGEWKLLLQRQYQGPFKVSDGVNWKLEVDVQSDGGYRSLQTSFENRRLIMQQSIIALGKKLGVDSAIINGAVDGTYGGSVEFDENDASIRGWKELRDAMKVKLEIFEKQDIDTIRKIVTNYVWGRLKELFAALGIGETQDMDARRKKAIDYVCWKHKDRLDAAQELDRIWLWLQIKKATGKSGNESTGGEVQHNDTISERYAEMERYLSSDSDNAGFKKGYENYDSINIPQFEPIMTSSEMKALFVTTDQLSEEEQGALCRRISIASNQEPLLELHNEIQSDFESQSKGFLESAPQHFFLSNVGDKYGGRCYPLVRAMAVALSTGEEVAKSFLDKLREFSQGELTDSQQRNAKCLRDALAGLHANVEAHSASIALTDMFGIPDVLEKLRSSKQTELYALNTQAHSMLVGVTVIDDQKKYYFYDPNFLIASFAFEPNFQQAMERFFVGHGFAKHYEAFGKAEDRKFKLVLIDNDKMGHARVEGGITVKQISSGIDLGDIFDSRERDIVVGVAESHLAGDQDLRAALTVAEAYDWTARLQDASIRLVREEGLRGNWIPLLDTLHESTDGLYEMQYMNASNSTEETLRVSTRDKTFKEFTSYLDPKWKALRKDFTFKNGKFKAHAAVEGHPIDGLNAMIAVQTIIDWLHSGANDKESAASESINSNLLLAIKVHSYMNVVQIGYTSVVDIDNVATLVKTVLQGEQLAGKVSLSTFSNGFKSMASEGFGVVLGFAHVGLDAYELWLARDDVKKATFGTQLAFDLASSVAGVAGIGAGIVGASGVAMALSGAGVLLAGLGIGFGALAQTFGEIATDAQGVGNYFADVDEAYSSGGYIYKTDEKALVPRLGAVVTRIQMADHQIEVGFDSQFIYRTRHGSTGSGRINYILWAGHMPQMVKDRSQAINVREGIGYKNDGFELKFGGEADILVLPATPKSFISYDYQFLPFTTLRHDRGFDVIRRLEEDERFDYDFYIFPVEHTIRKIQIEYVETEIVVVLDKRSLRLQIYPELPEEILGRLIYEVEGTGGEYCISLPKGPSQLSLKTNGLDAKKTTWIIDAKNTTWTLGDDSVKVNENLVSVGSTTIHLLNQEFNRLLIISPVGEVLLVDLVSQRALIQSEDAGKWTGNNETLQQHLQKMASEHRLSGHLVVVNDYTAEDNGQKRKVGRAYYDAFTDRMLYTDVEADIGCEVMDVLPYSDERELPNGRVYTEVDAKMDANITRDAFLGAVVGNDAYFYNTPYKSLWRVDAETHRITAKYYTCTQFEDADIGMSAVSQQSDFLSMAISPINQAGKGVEEIKYLVHKDRMVLSTVIGNSDMFRRIHLLETLSLTELVGGRETLGMTILEKLAGQTLVLPSDAEFVTVLCKDESGGQFCCWLRTSDDTLIRANLQQRINDLILTSSSHKEHGREVFYFYSRKSELVYCQQGPGHVNDSQAKQIEIPGLTNLFSVLGEVFATTKDGRILRLLVDGSLYLEALNEHWLAEHPKWWLDLARLDGKKATSIAVLGVQDSNKSVVPIWYQDGEVVIASSKLHGKQLQIMGFNDDGQAAWLFDRESGLLYRQPFSTSGAMDAMFNTEGQLINEGVHEIPEAEAMLGGERVKNPAMVDGSLRVTTESGVVLVVSGHSGMASMVAVDWEWQSKHENEKEDLNNLAKKWPHFDVVVLQGESDNSVPGWYHIPSGERVTARGLKWSDHPAWIGNSIDGLTFYIYANCSLYAVERASGATSEKGRFTAAKVHGKSLVLQSTSPNAEISIPTVVDLDFAVVSATNAKVVIDEENWKRYKVIRIQNKMEGNGNLMVEIKYSDDHVLIYKRGNDMVLIDGRIGNSIILANVLAEETEQGVYKVKVGLGIDGKEFMISSFRERLLF